MPHRHRQPWVKWTTVRDLANTHVFVFGDNLAHMGKGGQAAACRGQPNAFGVPTKKLPSMRSNAFFTDDELEDNKRAIDQALAFVPMDGRRLVILAGIGEGRAQLAKRAPRTFAYLKRRLDELEDLHALYSRPRSR
jgi:hypothetical protein